MIILINWWLPDEPEVTEFYSRQEAEAYIREHLDAVRGRWWKYDAYEGVELGIRPDGSLYDIERR